MQMKIRLSGAVLLAAALFTGCSTNEKDEKQVKQEVISEPVTLKVAMGTDHMNDIEFDQYVVQPVKKKYPHITLERISDSLPKVVTSGVIPDIATNWPGFMDRINDLELVHNMDALVKKHSFDLNRIEPEVVQTVKNAANKEFTAGIGIYSNPFGLFYNKDVFDRFAVGYPKDGMSWEEVRDLAVRLTRMDNGTQYRGLFPDALTRAGHQLSLPYVDFTTNKGKLTTDVWVETFQLWKSILDIPGNNAAGGYPQSQKDFLNGTLAMMAGHGNTLNELRKPTSTIKWDVVTYPSNKRAPGVGQRVDSPIMSVTEQSKYKDAAFQVIAVVLSDEVQSEMTRNGRATVLKNPAIKQQFGQNMTELAGKNIQSMAKPKFAVMAPVKYLPEGKVNEYLNNAFDSVIQNKEDINTALRSANEKLDALIQQTLEAKK